ncbi:hypothetical protein BJ138DRAFT_1147976 [Hygrophoropsis aurantiaca]|uniref:Uncharacterized protein n=1 Tax=Hygrophoropsis aurantiaca TaxID=72124 RepID=A0ACB8AI51_9AGAM|nr:hypothetical protein BJ138DRAFT_1147976 [Hygrophoropsis aurantiaca]
MQGRLENSLNFGRLHQRTVSLKAQGIPLISLKRKDHQRSSTHSSAYDLASVQENEDNEDNPNADSEFIDIDMATTATATADSLPTPVVHKSSHSSMQKDRREFEDEESRMKQIKKFLAEDIDTDQATAPLSIYCFMTGFIDSVIFSAVFVWCAFQTGNSVQLALAIARLFSGAHDYSFHLADQQAFCSLITFIFGAFIGRIGDKMGAKSRGWLVLGTMIQTLFTMSAALTIWKSQQGSVADVRDDPAWTNALSFVCIGFMSASMGLQGIMGKRLNTQFTTTVVLTTTWCELMADPKLFDIRRLVISRDHKIMAIGALFIGGFIGRAILQKIGSAGTLGVGTGIRLLVTIWWLFVPAKPAKK